MSENQMGYAAMFFPEARPMAERYVDAKLECRLCFKKITVVDSHYEAVRVCSKCASIIHGLYDLKHGGQSWTYNWPPADPNRKTGKKPVPENLRWRVFERDDFTCKQCGKRRNLQADHIVPQSLGGATTLDNLQTLCRTCNNRKRTSIPMLDESAS